MSSPSAPHRRRSNELFVYRIHFMPQRGPNWLFSATLALVIMAMCSLASPSSGWTQAGMVVGEPIRLTNQPGEYGFPAWSPDGTKIAFASATEFNSVAARGGLFYSHSEIHVMNADGSNPARLTHSPTGATYPAWSPDGTKIAFHRGDGGGALYVMNADGSNPVRLRRGRYLFPAWSPDGTRIACSLPPSPPSDPRNLNIHVMNADGSNPVQLTHYNNNAEAFPTWSPDGTKIAFWRTVGNGSIYVMNADGSNHVQLEEVGRIPRVVA